MTGNISLIPQPSSMTLLEGEYLLSNSMQIFAAPAFLREAEYLAGKLRSATAFPFVIGTRKAAPQSAPAIELIEDPALQRLGKEGYQLAVEGDSVKLRSSSAAGIFYAIQTLLQLLPPALFDSTSRPDVPWTLPRVTIEDSPRFGWRGGHLDCGRHFMPLEFIRKFIDLLALHKLNVFHWHLTEDQGWRIEIKKYPKLTEIGAWRRETQRGPCSANLGGDGIPHGGFYSQEEIRGLVAYASERHITILPEIEMPGHSQAAIAAYPELGCTSEKLEVEVRRGGVNENILNPSEKTIAFMQDVLTEVLALFPSRFIHVGGDEATKTQWEASPVIRARMTEVGAKDMHELQSYFIRRMDHFLTVQGRRLVGWDEILEGGLAPGATVMSWRGEEGGIAAARMGHDVVMTPCTHTYFDYRQSDDIASEPHAYGCSPLEKVLAYEPIPAELTPEEAKHVLGIQGQLWTEYMSTSQRVEYMAFPRLCALAEAAWSSSGSRQDGSFHGRLRGHLKRFNMLGVAYRPLED